MGGRDLPRGSPVPGLNCRGSARGSSAAGLAEAAATGENRLQLGPREHLTRVLAEQFRHEGASLFAIHSGIRMAPYDNRPPVVPTMAGVETGPRREVRRRFFSLFMSIRRHGLSGFRRVPWGFSS